MLCLGLTTCVPAARAEQSDAPAPHPTVVTLPNGDRISGLLQPSGPGGLALATSLWGHVEWPWSGVTAVTFGDALRVTLTDGRTLTGTGAWADGQLTLRTEGQTDLARLAPSGITALTWRDQPAPTWRERWGLTGDFSADTNRGNAETTDLGGSASATGQWARGGIGFYGKRSFSSVRSGDAAEATADSATGGVRADRYLVGHTFVFASTDVQYDRFKQVFRAWTSVGTGWDVVATRRVVLSGSAGLSRGRDAVRTRLASGIAAGAELEVSRTYSQLQLGNGFRWKVGRRGAVLSQDFTLYRQLGAASVGASGGQGRSLRLQVPASGMMRFELAAQITAPVSSWLSVRVALQDSYTNHPYPGSVRNDVVVTGGVSVRVGRRDLTAYAGQSSNVGSVAASGLSRPGAGQAARAE